MGHALNIKTGSGEKWAALESSILAGFTPATLALIVKFCVRPVSAS